MYLVSVGANIPPRRRKVRKQEHEELVPFWEKTATLSRGSTGRLCARLVNSIFIVYVCIGCIVKEKILVALLPEKERKVDVFFFGDKKQFGKRENKEAADKIVADKIPVKFEGNDHKLMNHKLQIEDGKILMHGTFNWSEKHQVMLKKTAISSIRKLIKVFAYEFHWWFCNSDVYDSCQPDMLNLRMAASTSHTTLPYCETAVQALESSQKLCLRL